MRVNGAAVGIGATMMLAMDARLFSTKARFGLVFGKLGITPEACSTWFLPRIVGLPTALDLLYGADILDAGWPRLWDRPGRPRAGRAAGTGAGAGRRLDPGRGPPGRFAGEHR